MPLRGDFRAEFSFRFPCLACQIPYSAEQGILGQQQGIVRAGRGMDEARAPTAAYSIQRPEQAFELGEAADPLLPAIDRDVSPRIAEAMQEH